MLILCIVFFLMQTFILLKWIKFPKSIYDTKEIYSLIDRLEDLKETFIIKTYQKGHRENSLNHIELLTKELKLRQREFNSLDRSKYDVFHLDLYQVTLLRFEYFIQSFYSPDQKSLSAKVHKTTDEQSLLIRLTDMRNRYQKLSFFERIEISFYSMLYIGEKKLNH